jgi:hypothetical protein
MEMNVLAQERARSLLGRVWRWPIRGAGVALLVVSALAADASTASAVIVHLANGKTLSDQPLRGAVRSMPFDVFFSNLDYNGGPVMASNTNYAVYWHPSGAPAYPSDYQAGVNQFMTDLAHDSGGHENVDSVSAQYNDAAGEFANYSSHFGGALMDTDPYPANGCKQAPICLTDAQLQAELSKYVKAQGLPVDLAHEYFLLTPPKVEDCFEASGVECSAGSKKPFYCAYHSNVPVTGGGELIYSNDPYVTGNSGCDDGNHPNGTTSDGVLMAGLSHEHNESITDPEPNNAWTDFGGSGGENGDKCRTFAEATEFGTPLGTAPNGAKYNQVINGRFYWYQQEWSNQGNQCLQRLTFSGAEPTATFTSKPGAGNEATFNATGSTAPGGVARYNWQFNDGPGVSAPVETTAPTVSHAFATKGPYVVALTVFAKDGTSIGTARTIEGGNVVGAPTVVTGAASAITQTSATLNATVNPNGGTVSECKFEYGTTTGYGQSASCASLPGSGTSPVAVSAPVTGLTANTTYHFRVSATNAGGTSTGSDETFKTLPNAPTVVTGAASAITQTSATLNATVNPNGGAVSECKLEYGTTNSYGQSASCASLPGSGTSPVAVSAPVTGLTANTTYHFRVSATNAGGTSTGSDQTFKTLPNPPAVLTGTASAVGSGAATLNATVNPNGGAVSECKLEYGTTNSYGSSAPCSPSPGSGSSPVAVSASAPGLVGNTTYHFRVSATNAGGTSNGSDQTFKTLLPPHWYSEGRIRPEGAKTPDIEWGDLALNGAMEVSCHTAIGGWIENPVGGGAGIDATEAFAAWACVANYTCPAGTRPGVEPQRLPWPSVLEEIGGKIRDNVTGVKVKIGCQRELPGNAAGENEVIGTNFVVGKQKDEPLAPAGATKGTSALHPGSFVFDTGSGHLEAEGSEGAVLVSTEGELKILGFEEQRLINARNP